MPKQERRCVACRQVGNQNDLIRIAKIDGEFVLDKLHKLGGRGAYICNNSNCLNIVIKKHLLNKAFKTNVNSSIYEELISYEQNN